MTSPSIVRYESILSTPWKNGRGVTRNVCDDATEQGDWSWRVSIAAITGEQPYSSFPGVHRDQVALGPGAVRLSIDGEALVLDPEEVISFEGEANVLAQPKLEGFLDLNVMSRRDDWESETSVASPTESLIVPTDGHLVLVALADSCVAAGHDLRRLDSVWCAGEHQLAQERDPQVIAVSGRFVIARLTRHR